MSNPQLDAAPAGIFNMRTEDGMAHLTKYLFHLIRAKATAELGNDSTNEAAHMIMMDVATQTANNLDRSIVFAFSRSRAGSAHTGITRTQSALSCATYSESSESSSCSGGSSASSAGGSKVRRQHLSATTEQQLRNTLDIAATVAADEAVRKIRSKNRNDRVSELRQCAVQAQRAMRTPNEHVSQLAAMLPYRGFGTHVGGRVPPMQGRNTQLDGANHGYNMRVANGRSDVCVPLNLSVRSFY